MPGITLGMSQYIPHAWNPWGNVGQHGQVWVPASNGGKGKGKGKGGKNKHPNASQQQQEAAGAAATLTQWSPPPGKMGIYPVDGEEKLIVPYAPREVTYSGYGHNWEEVSRDGDRAPLLMPSSRRLRTMSFTLFIGDSGWENSYTRTLQLLRELADATSPLLVVYSTMEAGLWRISDMTISSVLRVEGSNEVARANVDITFSRASDVSLSSGPVTGGVKSGKGSGKDSKIPQTYTVQKGDTLHSIAVKFFHDASKWKDIAKLNKIQNPKAKTALKVGTKIKLRNPEGKKSKPKGKGKK